MVELLISGHVLVMGTLVSNGRFPKEIIEYLSTSGHLSKANMESRSCRSIFMSIYVSIMDTFFEKK